MADNETKPPELAVLDPHFVRNLWAKVRPPRPMDYAKFGRIRREIAEGTYLTPEKEAIAVDRLIDVVDAMLPGLTLPAAGVGDVEGEWDRDNDGDRFE